MEPETGHPDSEGARERAPGWGIHWQNCRQGICTVESGVAPEIALSASGISGHKEAGLLEGPKTQKQACSG
jgi:hypothetical protein